MSYKFKFIIILLLSFISIFGFLFINGKSIALDYLSKGAYENYKNFIINSKKNQIKKNIEIIHQTITIYQKVYKLSLKKAHELNKSKEMILDYIKELAVNKKDYFWVSDKKLNLIMHPYNNKIANKNAKSFLDKNNYLKFDKAYKELQPNKVKFITYKIGVGSKMKHKLAAIILLDNWNWIIGKSIDLSEIYGVMDYLKSDLKKSFSKLLLSTFIILTFSGILFIYLILYFSEKSIFNPIEKKFLELNESLEIKNTQLEKKLYFDELTNIHNMNALKKDIIDTKYATLLMIDIDSFDNINKLYGYNTGDEILYSYAQRLSSFGKRNHYKVYRLYSNTFALLGQKGDFKVEEYYRDILTLIGKEKKIQITKDLIIELDINLGIVLYQDRVIVKAITALSKAKNLEKRYYVYNGSIEDKYKIESFNNMRKVIHKVIDNQGIIPYFQKIVDKDGNVIKYESLMRLENNNRILTPYNFMDIAIKTKLYIKLSEMMIEKVLKKAVELNINVSINLSYSDITDYNIVNLLDKYLNNDNLYFCKLITFEILEDQNLEDIEFLNKFIHKYKELGVTIAIDDFGSGYSNFSNIIKIKPDYIKIDGSLIKEIDSDKHCYEVVKSIVDFSKTMNIKVIAEFVHKEEIFNICKDLDIDAFQGYYFNKPEKELIKEDISD